MGSSSIDPICATDPACLADHCNNNNDDPVCMTMGMGEDPDEGNDGKRIEMILFV